MKNTFTCALTGHRDLPIDFDENALYDLLFSLADEGCYRFYCGMAEGFDLSALRCLIEIKKRKNILVRACIPFPGQENTFQEINREFYKESLSFCDEKVYTSSVYSKWCFHIRNRYMVDHADMLLAFCIKNEGGTYYTVKYAQSLEKEIIFFPKKDKNLL